MLPYSQNGYRGTCRSIITRWGGGAAASGGGEPPPKDEKVLKEWITNKLKALAWLLGKLGIKAAEALPGTVGGIISWILNRAKDVVGWVSQNIWTLVVSVGAVSDPEWFRRFLERGQNFQI